MGRFPFRSNPKALVSGETEGLIKVVAIGKPMRSWGFTSSGRMQAPSFRSLPMMNQRAKAEEFTRLVQVHPTLPEALKEAVLDVGGMAIHLPRPLREMGREVMAKMIMQKPLG